MSVEKVDINKLAEIIALSIKDLSKEELEELLVVLKDKYNLEPAVPEVIEVAAEVVEEKTSFKIELISKGSKGLGLVKAWKPLSSGLSLMQAKAMIDSAPVVLKEGITIEEANVIKTEFEAASPDCKVVIS